MKYTNLNISENDEVECRLKESDKWLKGIVTHIDHERQSVFVKTKIGEIQFEWETDFPNLIRSNAPIGTFKPRDYYAKNTC